MTLPIVRYPESILRKVTEPVDAQELSRGELRPFIQSMIETMHHAQGVGIAANQVGKSLALCIVSTRRGPLVLANPTITRASFRKEKEEEGCLSLPGVFGDLRRSRRVHVEALDERGQPLAFIASGFFARVIQHELDHLNGKLFIDRTRNITHGRIPLS